MSDEYDLPRSGATAWIMPMVTVLTALVIGLLAGVIVGYIVFRGDNITQVVQQELTNEELDSLCAVKVDEAVGEAADELTVAQERVATLQDDVFSRERKVAELEAEMTRRAERGRSLSAELVQLREELEAARAELTEVKAELAEAVEEKEALFVQLRYTEEQLAEQRVETSVAREDALSFKWQSFVTASQLEVCEKGGRRRMGRCRETVTSSIASFRTEFEHCIRSGQEMPNLREAERNTEVLPMFAKWIGQDERITRDWFVLLCDPTLPEADGWDARP